MTRKTARAGVAAAWTFAALGGGLLALAPLPASASPTPTGSTTTTISAGLWVTGVDEAVASKAGYNVKRFSNGRFQLVPKSASSGLKASPIYDPQHAKQATMKPNAYDYDESKGDCGTSYISVQNTSSTKVNLHSGFSLSGGRKATDIDWKVKLSDRNGTSYQKTSTNIHGTSGDWATGWTGLNQYVYSNDSIVTPDSKAHTTDGSLCTAGKASVSISMS